MDLLCCAQHNMSIIEKHSINDYRNDLLIRAFYIDFVIKNYPNIVQVMSFEEYAKRQNRAVNEVNKDKI